MYLSRAAARTRQGIVPVARGSTIPAPVKGWNERDPLDGMDPGYAVTLDNWFPQTGYVELRGGSASHATGIGTGVVETLFEHRSGANHKLLAFGNSAVYDASASGAVGSALDSGFTNNRWQGVNFTTYSVHVNGADTPRTYDGTTFTTTSFTGVTATELVNVAVFKNRLFFAQKDSASFWYGGLFAIAGSLSEFKLNAVYPAGGNLVAIGTLTVDGGLGIDDLCCFIMESGAVLIYAGTDPGDATAWSLVGIFQIGAPVGRRCLVRVGTDLIVITQDGYVPLLQFVRAGRQARQLAISDKISGAVNRAVRAFGGNFGWQPALYPRGPMLLFNVPVVEGSQYHQHVMNTITGAWCRFKGMNAVCWCVFDDELYFGGIDGKVYKADTGFSDSGANIEADGQTAYQYFGGRGQLKHFTMYRPVMATDGNLPVSMGLGVDFQQNIPTFVPSDTTSSGSEWDVAAWDDADWAGAETIQKNWQAAGDFGYSASIRVRTATKAQNIKWYASDILYQPGGYV